MKKLTFLAAILMICQSAIADDHGRMRMVGSGFDFNVENHMISGSYKDIEINAKKACGKGVKGTLTKNNEETSFDVTINEGSIKGNFNGEELHFSSLDKDSQVVWLTIDNEQVPVKFEYESFDGHHYANITFKYQLDGENYEVLLEGEGCIRSTIVYSMLLYGIASFN